MPSGGQPTGFIVSGAPVSTGASTLVSALPSGVAVSGVPVSALLSIPPSIPLSTPSQIQSQLQPLEVQVSDGLHPGRHAPQGLGPQSLSSPQLVSTSARAQRNTKRNIVPSYPNEERPFTSRARTLRLSSMPEARLRELLTELHEELEEDDGPLDAETRALLREARLEIQEALAEERKGTEAVPNARGRIAQAIERFEDRHPDGVALLNRVLEALTHVGI